jgi:hypothetical protein
MFVLHIHRLLASRDSKRAEEINDDLEEQEDFRPRSRVEQEAHSAYLAAKNAEKRE